MSKIENQKVEIWLRREATFYYIDQTNIQFPKDYAHVATLTGIEACEGYPNLSAAFKRSNNIDSTWIKDDGVEINEEGCVHYCFGGEWDGRGMRSSSVGDIFRCVGTGVTYEVAPSGFKRHFPQGA